MRVTPYNTGRVLIGCNYIAPVKPWFPSRTETMLQASMLQTQKSKQAKPVTARQTDWDGILIIAGSIAILAAAYAIGWLAI